MRLFDHTAAVKPAYNTGRPAFFRPCIHTTRRAAVVRLRFLGKIRVVHPRGQIGQVPTCSIFLPLVQLTRNTSSLRRLDKALFTRRLLRSTCAFRRTHYGAPPPPLKWYRRRARALPIEWRKQALSPPMLFGKHVVERTADPSLLAFQSRFPSFPGLPRRLARDTSAGQLLGSSARNAKIWSPLAE